jgi:hypothetical protein
MAIATFLLAAIATFFISRTLAEHDQCVELKRIFRGGTK